jgi:antitoxin (DNA-binding transcriptional repressor) of toxin-antitoxin stability system
MYSCLQELIMTIPKIKSITDLRISLFETFDEVVSGETLLITHKNGSMVAMVPVDQIEKLTQEVELHKSLAIGYAQALRGEGIATSRLKEKLKKKEKELRAKHG